MPTTRPRYTLTDAGELSDMLDLAARRWPGAPRKELLLQLARAGRGAVQAELESAESRRARQAEALDGLHDLVDWNALAGDAAWR